MPGLLVVFEGIDGSGKQTQTRLLCETLTSRGIPARAYSYPDYGSRYGHLIGAFLKGEFSLTSREQFLLYLLDIVKDRERVQQDLHNGEVVLMDRYFLSTIAYQSAQHIGYEPAKQIVTLLDLPTPSLVFYLHTPVEIAMERKRHQKGRGDILEENRALLQDVSRIYQQMMREGFPSANWVRIDGTADLNTIHQQVLAKVLHLTDFKSPEE